MDFAFKTIHEFNDYFKDEKTCYEFFEGIRWNGVPVCPHCGTLKSPYRVKARGKFQDIPSYRCSERPCGLPFTVRTKSIFEGSKVEFRKWLQAAYEITTCKKGISSIELGTRIGVSQKTAWFINHRLRAMLKETEPTLLKDFAAIDESYIGGKNINKHADKKIPNSQGRSSKGKTMVFGARGLRGQVKTQIVPDADAATVIPIVENWVEKGAIMVSDEWSVYKNLRADYFHITVNHKEGEYVNGAFSTNGLENFWSIFKRGIIGVFHSISPQHLQAYADEFSDRYNKKDLTNIERFEQAAKRFHTARLTYKALLGRKVIVDEYLSYKRDSIS
jgi:transposase-like protein